MAQDKSNNLTIFLEDIANAINEVRGVYEPLNPQVFSDYIRQLSFLSDDFEFATTQDIIDLFYTITADLDIWASIPEIDHIFGIHNWNASGNCTICDTKQS